MIGRLKKFFSTRILVVFALLLLFLGISAVFFSSHKVIKRGTANLPNQQNTQVARTSGKQAVLGRGYRTPGIYIYGGSDRTFSSGGLIALASTDEPAVQVEGHNISGSAEIALYVANEEALLDYLTHDKDGNQTKKNSGFKQISVRHNYQARYQHWFLRRVENSPAFG